MDSQPISMIAAITMAGNSSVTINPDGVVQYEDPFGHTAINLSLGLMAMMVLSLCLPLIKGNKTRSPTGLKKIGHPPESSALKGFVSLGNNILYQRSTIPPKQDNDTPDLIVLCTWMGAAQTYIAKYASTYTHQFPSASQLIISSSLADMTWRNHTSQRNRIDPAVNVLSPMLEKNLDARILLHVFSDGGANSACQLAHQLRVRGKSPFPAAAIILDSTPGRGTYRTCRDAIVNSIPSSVLARSIGIPLTHIYLISVWIIQTILRVENVRERRRLDLNEAELFSPQAPRLYIYSKADKIIPWTGVEDHTDAARKAGLRVEQLRFEETPHVGHIRQHASTYWEAVKMLWVMRSFQV